MLIVKFVECLNSSAYAPLVQILVVTRLVAVIDKNSPMSTVPSSRPSPLVGTIARNIPDFHRGLDLTKAQGLRVERFINVSGSSVS
jgi:hypothetical protein